MEDEYIELSALKEIIELKIEELEKYQQLHIARTGLRFVPPIRLSNYKTVKLEKPMWARGGNDD